MNELSLGPSEPRQALNEQAAQLDDRRLRMYIRELGDQAKPLNSVILDQESISDES